MERSEQEPQCLMNDHQNTEEDKISSSVRQIDSCCNEKGHEDNQVFGSEGVLCREFLPQQGDPWRYQAQLEFSPLSCQKSDENHPQQR